jgi:hypothetical protein
LLLESPLPNGRIIPNYLTERDEPWLRALLDEHARYVGRKRTELVARLSEPLLARTPKAKLRVAAHVLDGLSRHETSASVPPREVRAQLFRAAARSNAPRHALVAEVASALAIGEDDLEAALFADLRGERRVAELPRELSPHALALEANLVLVSSLLRRAARVRITAYGNTRALVRHARLLGLLCVLERPRSARPAPASPELDAVTAEPIDGVILNVSGPFALFRRTEVYGRALASLIPRVLWCPRFEVEAACALGRGSELSMLLVRSGDPIGAGRELARYDSRVEERFAKDFAKVALDWDVLREPRPFEAGDAWIFPDFELAHRHDPGRRWLLEIVGFWTVEYLEKKLDRLRRAALDRLILCIDDERRCDTRALPKHAHVVRYSKRIDAASVLSILEERSRANAARSAGTGT